MRPDRDEVLTVDDLNEFDVAIEAGTATILRVHGHQRRTSLLATIDESGYVRELDDRRRVVDVDWPADVKVVD
jgi:hypothetical protein